jgi:hypothetical protein
MLPAGVPEYTMKPSASTRSLSKPAKTADDGWWIDVTTVLPESARVRSTFIRATAEVESSPEVGSSSRSTRGSVSSSVPMLVRFFSPPEMSMMGVFAHFCSRSWLMVSSTRATFAFSGSESGSRSSAVYLRERKGRVSP